jgi:hypothetical protein
MPKCGPFISLAVLVPLLAPTSAVADPIRFTFTYEPLPTPPACSVCQNYPSFSFSFITPSFITTTGMFALPMPVAIGEDTITHAGTNNLGIWVFGNGVGESIADLGWGLEFDTLAFEFSSQTHRGYIDHAGTFSGYFVQGLTSHLRPPQVSLSGTGTVAVSAVPEPGTLILVGTGALVAIGCRRWKHRAYRVRHAVYASSGSLPAVQPSSRVRAGCLGVTTRAAQRNAVARG